MMDLAKTLAKTEAALVWLESIKDADETGFGRYHPCDPSIDRAISSARRKLALIYKAIGGS